MQIRKEIKSHLCGSIIISARVVLTAAHCVDKSSVREVVVVVGITNLQDAAERNNQYNILRTIPHEHFNKDNLQNDIAILLLQRKIEFSSKVKPIELDKLPGVARKGVTAISAGWGETFNYHEDKNHLRSVNLKIIDEQECQGLFKLRNIICAGEEGGMKGVAFGDSGGPLVVDNQLVGITSFMVHNNYHHVGLNGYTRVANFHSWIEKNAGSYLRNN